MIKVKPLHWQEERNSGGVLIHTAYTGTGKTRVNHFMTYCRDDGKIDLYRLTACSSRPTFPTIEAAKRAAQIEWEAFILSVCSL